VLFVGVPVLDKFNMLPSVLALASLSFTSRFDRCWIRSPGFEYALVPAGQEPNLGLAFTPLALPLIITPAGIAAVIVFMALASDAGVRLQIVGLLLILLLDPCEMLFACIVLRVAAMPLPVFGAAVGIDPLALGLPVSIR
jgi:hypothetical protein